MAPSPTASEATSGPVTGSLVSFTRSSAFRTAKSQVSRLLKRLGWTPQVPITRAIQRNEEAIERWRVEAWPVLKEKARRQRRTIVFVDESGCYLLPGVVKTYAPRGKTPVLDEWQTRDHLSVMGGVTPQGKVYSLVRPHSFNGLHSVAFLAHLLRVVGGRLLVIWDGSPIHRRAEVKAFLADQAGNKIHLEALPPYAPDLKPGGMAVEAPEESRTAQTDLP